MHAQSLNRIAGITGENLNFIKGNLLPGETGEGIFPATLGYEASGVVEAVGSDIDTGWIGKHVTPVGPFDFLTHSTLGYEAIVPGDRLIEYPSILSSEQAAALWIPYLTAYPIYSVGRVKKGDFVVITAATSTVGNAAIQYVMDAGAIPIGTTRSTDKAEALKKVSGIEHVIVTEKESYMDRISEITDGKGTNIAFDAIGGDFIIDIADGMAQGGIIFEYGILGGGTGPLPIGQLIGKGLYIHGYAVNEIADNEKTRNEATKFILDRIISGQFKPLVAKNFPMSEYVAAFEQLDKNDLIGRIVLVTD